MLKKYFIAVVLLFYSVVALATNSSIQDIQKVTNQWAVALSSGDPEKIANLYDKEALLYATFKNRIENHQDLVAYFKNLMQKPNLKVDFQKQDIRVFWETAINSGLYTFSYTANGKTVSVPARYTFVYILEPNGWMIVDHHSSVLPEKVAS